MNNTVNQEKQGGFSGAADQTENRFLDYNKPAENLAAFQSQQVDDDVRCGSSRISPDSSDDGLEGGWQILHCNVAVAASLIEGILCGHARVH